jgi:hypothetical protein
MIISCRLRIARWASLVPPPSEASPPLLIHGPSLTTRRRQLKTSSFLDALSLAVRQETKKQDTYHYSSHLSPLSIPRILGTYKSMDRDMRQKNKIHIFYLITTQYSHVLDAHNFREDNPQTAAHQNKNINEKTL